MNPKATIDYMRFRTAGLTPRQAIQAVRNGESAPKTAIYINTSGFRQMERRAANRLNPQRIHLRQEVETLLPSGLVYRAYAVNKDGSLARLFLAEESAESLMARIQRNDPGWCYTFTIEPMRYRNADTFTTREALKSAADSMYAAMHRAAIMWANLAHSLGYNHRLTLKVESVYRKRQSYAQAYYTRLQIDFPA